MVSFKVSVVLLLVSDRPCPEVIRENGLNSVGVAHQDVPLDGLVRLHAMLIGLASRKPVVGSGSGTSTEWH